MRTWTVLRLSLCLVMIIPASISYAKEGALTIVESDDAKEETINSEEQEDIIEEPFQPSESWKSIKPGQAIPAGLHVRINLETGQKEAKILDKDDGSNEDESGKKEKFEFWHTENGRKGAVNKQSKKFSPQELKDALKLLKAEDYHSNSEEELQRIHSQFRSIEELKKEFTKMNLAMKSDSEILSELLRDYPKANSKKKVGILQNIEYLVHQYDAAQEFVKMGGLKKILPDLNSTDSKLRSFVAFTTGSAMQGNPPVQIAVLESNIMLHLLRLLINDPTDEVQLKALFALSCLIRQFPLAQQRFTDNGGISALAELFKQNTLQSSKLQLKAVTLLHDLFIEQQLAKEHSTNDKSQEERAKQYKNFNLQDRLVQHGFCHLIPKLLLSPDYDTQEKVINAMISFTHLCYDQFARHLDILQSLAHQYHTASVKEQFDDDDVVYFATLYDLVQNLVLKIQQNSKDEL